MEIAAGFDTDMDGVIVSGDIAAKEDLDLMNVEAWRKLCSAKTTMNDTFPMLEEPPTACTDTERNPILAEIGVCRGVEYSNGCGV